MYYQPSQPKIKSVSDIELLQEASNFTYKALAQIERVQANISPRAPTGGHAQNHFTVSRFRPPTGMSRQDFETHSQTINLCFKLFKQKGYEVYAARGPQGGGSMYTKEQNIVENSRLGYAVLIPKQPSSGAPIIIAFRGTKGIKDMSANVKLAITGTVGKALRDEAFLLYREARKLFPNHPIVFTGHSQGGNIAHYVTLKAMATRMDTNLECRVFNSANIDTKYSQVLERQPHLKLKFVNYRTSADIVSSYRSRPGLSTNLITESGFFAAHSMKSVKQSTPSSLSQSRVGHSPLAGATELLNSLAVNAELKPRTVPAQQRFHIAIETAKQELRIAARSHHEIVETLEVNLEKAYGVHKSQGGQWQSQSSSSLPIGLVDALSKLKLNLKSNQAPEIETQMKDMTPEQEHKSPPSPSI